MTAYNRQNFYNMKREAVRSAKEMHGRTVSDNAQTDEKKLIGQNPQSCGSNNGFGGNIFESLGIKKGSIDSERIIIVLMIIMLAREGADLKLLLALGYIIM